ncbi:hypothetical protein [Micromonospora sp. NBC_00858]|uniref:hypothetical protein n=1 Tax=Micromonospora sp. NBC_00858 TaxID=2975979 RepID=UPI00386472DC
MYGWATPSSGGTTVGEALNILERFDLRSMTATQAMHYSLEAGVHRGQAVQPWPR